MSDLPATQAQAEAELRAIFLSKKWRFCYIAVDETPSTSSEKDANFSNPLVCHVLAILQKYPSLASERFDTGLADNITPLVCFCGVCSGSVPVSREVLQAVYDLYPDAAVELQSRSRQRTPLSLACLLQAPMEVIRFLLEKNPQARSVKSVEGTFPVETVVRSASWWATIGIPLTLDLCPHDGINDLRFGQSKRSLLEEALHCGFSVPDLRLIVEKYPPDQITVPETVSIERRSKSEFLASLMPKLKSFANHAQLCSSDAIETLLAHLIVNTSITSVVLVLRPRTIRTANCRLGAMLQENTRIESLCLKIPRTRTADTSIGDEILTGLRYNDTLRSLELDGFQSSVDLHMLQENGSNSVVTTLSLKNFRMPRPSLVALLNLFPELETFHLETVEIVDNEEDRPIQSSTGTSFLVHILGIRSLVCLSVRNCPWVNDDPTQICEPLKRNTSLKSFSVQSSVKIKAVMKELEEVLVCANTTLVDIDPCCFEGMILDRTACTIMSKIMYLLQLNKWGREVARAPDTNQETFLQLLARLNEDASSHELDDNQRLMIRFGLLQEGLVLWSIAS